MYNQLLFPVDQAYTIYEASYIAIQKIIAHRRVYGKLLKIAVENWHSTLSIVLTTNNFDNFFSDTCKEVYVYWYKYVGT